MGLEVQVKRTELLVPSIEDPERKVVQIQYQAGELPPHFLYIPKKEWTREKEAELIKADIKKRIETPPEIITIE